MKKCIITLLFIIFLTSFSAAYAQDGEIKVYTQINDIKTRVYFDSKPKIINGNTMIPVRNIADALGISVDWNEEEQELTLVKGFSVILQIGKDSAKWSPYGSIHLDVAPFIENNRTYVPLRFISETFNTNVVYDSDANSIYLSELIQDGWCVDYKGNYKIKVFKDYNFEGRVCMEDYTDVSFTIPFEDDVSLSMPVKSIIRAGRLNKHVDDVLNSIALENSDREKFKVESVSQNEYLISFEYNESESNNELTNEQRYVLMYLKQDGDTTLNSNIDCYPEYFSEYKEDIIDNLKSISDLD